MKFFVVGSGSWGTALANVLCDNMQDVVIYSQHEDIKNEINIFHTNKKYFNDVTFNSNIKSTTTYMPFIKEADFIILAIPSSSLESVIDDLIPFLHKKYIFINTIKGFISDKNLTVLEYLKSSKLKDYSEGFVSLIGPSHAEEVIKRDLTCICSTCSNLYIAKKVQDVFSNDYFRVYTLRDEIGAEICAAYKNAIAIASGILMGLNYGDNAKAALITRGLNEILRYSLHFKGEPSTCLGLAGLGDLVVTCNSLLSRNFMFGYNIGKSKDVNKVLSQNKLTVEGYNTVKHLYLVAKENNIETPIIGSLYNVLYLKSDINDEINKLMLRPLKAEY